jgi:excisionase family DNA binding protein
MALVIAQGVHLEAKTDFMWEKAMEYERLLNVAQVAEILGLSVATIRKWVLVRYIPYRKMGRAVRFSAPEIQEWAQGKSVAPPNGRQGISEIKGNDGGEK